MGLPGKRSGGKDEMPVNTFIVAVSFEVAPLSRPTPPRPDNYPMAPNSGIADAEAFSVGNSTVVHRPGRFPDGSKVVAVCGVYGWACESDSRIAYWRNAYIDCGRCLGNDA